MSISIAHILAKPVAKNAAANNAAASDPTTANFDFPSMLLGQMAAENLLKSDVQKELSLPEDLNGTPSDALAQDASLLLASLGVVFPPPQTPVDAAGLGLPLDVQETTSAKLGVSLYPEQRSLVATDSTPQSANDNGKAAIIAGSNVGQVHLDSPTVTAMLADGDKDATFVGNTSPEPGRINDFGSNPGGVLAGTAAARILSDRPGSDAIITKTLDAAVSEIPSSTSNTPNALQGTGNASPSPLPLALKVETPLRSHAWSEDFSQKVVWMTSNDKQAAQITINPPDMGPIEISLNLTKDNASAFFVSQNAEVRASIETALPRLKEMLANVGIELGQSNVSSQSSQQQHGNQETRHGSPRWIADNAILGGDSAGKLVAHTTTAASGTGLVDLFA